MRIATLRRGLLAAAALFLSSGAFAQSVRIAEFHYDNTGTDAGEAIEISAPAGTDLSGWEVVLYNGNNGAAYDTAQRRWRTLPNTGAPAGRYLHTAVWARNQMIVWGGIGAAGYLNSGARFNPTTQVWTALPKANAPSPR